MCRVSITTVGDTRVRPIRITFTLCSKGVTQLDRITHSVSKQVYSIYHPRWITTRPPPHPWGVVPRAVIIQVALLVPLLAGEAVALAGKAAKAGLAVGRVFLAVDQRPCVVNDQVAAAQVVTPLELHSWSGIVRKRNADADEGDTALVVHHMHGVVLLHC